MNTQPFSQTFQMIELFWEYLSVWCIWLYFIFTSHMHFRVNPHAIVAWMSRNFYHVRELSGCGFELYCCHLNFRYCICFKKRVPWHSGNCRVWIHSEMHMWHDNNTHSNAPYRWVLTTQLNHLARLAKCYNTIIFNSIV